MRQIPDGGLVRGANTRERATFLELFLDLVFAFALTRISVRLIDDFTESGRGVFAGLGQALVLFLALWAVWMLTVWSTSWLDPDAMIVQAVIVITMAGAMTMAGTSGKRCHTAAVRSRNRSSGCGASQTTALRREPDDGIAEPAHMGQRDVGPWNRRDDVPYGRQHRRIDPFRW
ncbi:low temperature requirement protein A [Micromonospora sp. NPDC049102]|uniref:low temperature requirement protein A n=1 Tax=Micromonospora sp. NPDC049102 TaxID=3364265 RepID=UPI00371D0FB4